MLQGTRGFDDRGGLLDTEPAVRAPATGACSPLRRVRGNARRWVFCHVRAAVTQCRWALTEARWGL